MPTDELDQERAALLDIHQRERRAHFELNSDLFTAHLADEWVYVRSGTISRQSRAEVSAWLSGSFDGASYHEWEDVDPPVVVVSSDATAGWLIARVHVRRTKRLASGEEREQSFTFAGITTFQKHDGAWLADGHVATIADAIGFLSE